jgi:hypothetical protein
VIEHVLRRLAEVDDPLADVRRPDAEGHVLGIGGAGGVVVAADAQMRLVMKWASRGSFPFMKML